VPTISMSQGSSWKLWRQLRVRETETPCTHEIYRIKGTGDFAIAAAAAGGIIAFYQLGYGIAAFGVGPLLDAGVTLPAVYAAAAGIAVAMGLLSFRVTRPAHPR
jgi:hypothetical protein